MTPRLPPAGTVTTSSTTAAPPAAAAPRPPLSRLRELSRRFSSFVAPAPVAEAQASSASPSATEEPPGKRGGRWVVDMDYLFVGARRVVVKDGNPTSPKPPPDWEPTDNGAHDDADADAEEEVEIQVDGYNMHEMDDVKPGGRPAVEMEIGGLFVGVGHGGGNLSAQSHQAGAVGSTTPRVVRRKVPFFRRFWRRLRGVFSCFSSGSAASSRRRLSSIRTSSARSQHF